MRTSRGVAWMAWAAQAAAVLVVGSCASITRRGSDEGPFLRPGPIGPLPGVAAAPVLGHDAVMLAKPGIPAGFDGRSGLDPLAGAEVPGIGPVRALVLSLSFGRRTPTFSELNLADQVFGDRDQKAETVGEDLWLASGAKFRFSATVLPTLVDPRRPADVRMLSAGEIRELTKETLMTWRRDTSLAVFDNDGADGIPHSRDDDGRLDMVFLVVESDVRLSGAVVDGNFDVPTSEGKLHVGKIHFLSVARNEDLHREDARRQVLAALGLDAGEQAFPGGYPRAISSVARARLGWLPFTPILASGIVNVDDGRGAVVPLSDVRGGNGFWLVERDGDEMYASRLAQKADGHYFASEVRHWGAGGEEVLALSRQLGNDGPRAYVTWKYGSSARLELLKEGGARRAPSTASAPVRQRTVRPAAADDDADMEPPAEIAPRVPEVSPASQPKRLDVPDRAPTRQNSRKAEAKSVPTSSHRGVSRYSTLHRTLVAGRVPSPGERMLWELLARRLGESTGYRLPNDPAVKSVPRVVAEAHRPSRERVFAVVEP